MFDGEALYAISDSGVGMFKIELPLVVGDWCWDPESVDEDGYSEGVCYLNEEGEPEDEDSQPRKIGRASCRERV